MSSTLGSPTKTQDANSPEKDIKTKETSAEGDKTEDDDTANTDKEDVEGDDKGEKKDKSEKEWAKQEIQKVYDTVIARKLLATVISSVTVTG